MKKIIFFLLLYSNLPYCSFAQEMVNADFSINSGNTDDHWCSCSGIGTRAFPSFLPGSILNWERTHGSPNLGGSPDLLYPFPPNYMFMCANGGAGIGEGIAGNYPFLKGEVYDINVGVAAIHKWDKIRIIAGKNPRPFTCECGRICDGEALWNGNVPVPHTISPTDPIMQEVSFSTLFVGDNHFTYIPNNYYDWVMIFPDSRGVSDCDQVDITLSHFKVHGNCKKDLYVPASVLPFSTSPLYPTIYTGYEHIYAGSTFGPTPTVAVVTEPSGATKFEASMAILLDGVFSAGPSVNNYFSATIIPPCTPACGASGPHCVKLGEAVNMVSVTGGGTWISTDNTSVTVDATGLVHGIALTTPADIIYIIYTLEGCAPVYLDIGVSDDCIDHGKPANIGNASTEQIEIQSSAIQVFPNPTQDKINISYPCKSAGQLEINIKDVSGRIRHAETVSCSDGGSVQYTIDASKFEPGVYFIDLTLNDQHVVKKIVKL